MVNLQKHIAMVILLASTLLTASILQDYAFCGILCILGLLGLQRRFIWNIEPERRVFKSLLLLLLLVIFALHYRFGNLEGVRHFAPTAEMAWQTITRFFLAAMVLTLFLGSKHTLPPSLALFHLAITISAGQILLLDGQQVPYRLLELCAVLLTTLFVATAQHPFTETTLETTSRRRSIIAFVLLIAVTFNTGWIVSTWLYQYQNRISILSGVFWGERLLTNSDLQEAGTIGFTTSGRLSTLLEIKQNPDENPTLTLTGDENPGYLRARAFDMFRNSHWSAYSFQKTLRPLREGFPSAILPGHKNVFRLGQPEASRWKYLQIVQHLRQTQVIFTPLGSAYIEAPLPRLGRDENGILYPSRNRLNLYQFAYARSGLWTPPPRDMRPRLLNIPTKLDPRIRALAERLFANTTTQSQKIDAVIQYFRNNYTYNLMMTFPPNEDPLTYFLVEGSEGYCEYFATGAAILLRLADVPTRYVTGFLVTEKDTEHDNTWIARHADAHAWVEAWDERVGEWKIVEATVQENLEATDNGANLNMKSPFMVFLHDLRRVFYEYGFVGAILWLLQQGGWLVGGFFALLLTSIIVVIWRRRSHHRAHENTLPANVQALHKLQTKMDRRLRRHGFRREPQETLLDFTERLAAQPSPVTTRLQAAIRWYQQYAGLRYRHTISTLHLEQLAQDLRKTRFSENH